jgi:hypothetical protein
MQSKAVLWVWPARRTGVAPVSIFKNHAHFLMFLIHLSKPHTGNQ